MTKSLTTEEFIKKAIITHNNKYDYSKTEYTNSHKKVTIKCTKHGFFSQTPNSHLNKSGCPMCGEKLRIEKILSIKAILEISSTKQTELTIHMIILTFNI